MVVIQRRSAPPSRSTGQALVVYGAASTKWFYKAGRGCTVKELDVIMSGMRPATEEDVRVTVKIPMGMVCTKKPMPGGGVKEKARAVLLGYLAKQKGPTNTPTIDT